jgi:nascent polypeptide-associated complex subunit alpha
MMPGMNPRKMQQMMKRMGIQQRPIQADKVIVIKKDKKLVFDNPDLSQVNMMGQQTFQLLGDYREEALSDEPEISEEDITTITSQTDANKETAKKALIKNKGDIAKTILELSE